MMLLVYFLTNILQLLLKNLVLFLFWFHSFASCSRLHNVQDSSFSNSFHKIPFLCPLLITYVRFLYRRNLPVFPSIYFSILFVLSTSYFAHLPTSNSYVHVCVFLFDSSLVFTSLLTQFQHSSFYFCDV